MYNAGEHVLGTTAPLWTLLLAGVRSIGIPDVAACAKVLAIGLDAFSTIAIFTLLWPSGLLSAYVGTALFVYVAGQCPHLGVRDGKRSGRCGNVSCAPRLPETQRALRNWMRDNPACAH
ncbi:MAG TPA: hypothetical protein VL126_06085 [Bacteroidota bacterium]|nr:hypothetical protein [Bacteroidota bacterium]